MDDFSLIPPVAKFLLEVFPNFLVIANRKRVLYANPKTRNLFGDLNSIKNILPSHLYSSKQKIVTKIIPTNHQPIIIQWNSHTLLPERGHSMVLLTGENISEKEALRQRVDILSYIITKVPGFVFWKDTHLNLMGCNDNFAKQVGLNSPQEVIGLTDYDLPWNSAQTEKFLRDDQEVIQTGIKKLNIEEKQRQLNGKDLWLLTSKVPLYNQDKIAGVLGIYVDITPFKEAEQALRAAKEKAEAANRLKSDFILNMQHDIRTPISGIWGMTELLAETATHVDTQSKLVAVARAAKELLDYCNDIIDFTHVEYGSRPVVNQPFSLKELVQSIIRMQTPAAKLKKIKLSTHYGRNTPDVLLGDVYRIKRVLINLISNAIKFTPKGYVKLKVQVEKPRDPGKEIIVNFTIQDSGIGIPAEKIDLIYEKFSKITPSNKGLYKGNGLGLRIVKKFIEEMSGNICVKSQLNQGTVFKVFLPLTIPLSNHILEG